MLTDTIAAIATAPGRAGIGIVRVSGPQVPDIAVALLGALPRPRSAELHVFRDAVGATIDTGLVLYFAAPASFTGEPVLELHGHGGSVVLQLLLSRVLSLGARQARPGEFSERAFLNDKIDLAQAEAIADLIESATAQAARAAIRSLEGAFSTQVHHLVEALVDLRMFVEAAIDFPEEEIDFLADTGLQQRLQRLLAELRTMQEGAAQGQLLRDGMTLVIAGRPNAGKSSLLNALSGRDSAIVTGIPGTTRDVLREQIQLDGLPLHLLDTAGLHASTDPVEQAGMARTRAAMQSADRVLLVIDDAAGWTAADDEILHGIPPHVACTRVYNKIDLTGRPAGVLPEHDASALAVSLTTGAGLAELRSFLKSSVGYHGAAEGAFSARQRHLDALGRARAAVEAGQALLEEHRAGELLAEELRQAQGALGEITGEVTSEDLLDRIFSHFCIGK
jgi:tRNA modification GTPase